MLFRAASTNSVDQPVLKTFARAKTWNALRWYTLDPTIETIEMQYNLSRLKNCFKFQNMSLQMPNIVNSQTYWSLVNCSTAAAATDQHETTKKRIVQAHPSVAKCVRF